MKRTHSQVDDEEASEELKRIYKEKMCHFGVRLNIYSDTTVCTICYSMLETYDSVKNEKKTPKGISEI